MENLFRAYMKTADAIKQKIESFKIFVFETDGTARRRKLGSVGKHIENDFI